MVDYGECGSCGGGEFFHALPEVNEVLPISVQFRVKHRDPLVPKVPLTTLSTPRAAVQ